MNLKTLAAGLGLLAFAASCSDDVTEEINSGPEISFTTRMSRAEQIFNSVEDLDEFVVYAEADGYKGLFINGDIATKQSGSSVFTLETAYRWPSDKISFWAFAPKLSDAVMSAADGGGISIGNGQASLNYEPTTYSKDENNSGASHKDLIVAYTEAHRSTDASGVPLTFHHALSQIELNAKLGEGNDRYDVKLKGAWFVNVKGKGTLSYDNTQENSFSWTTTTSKAIYGYEFDDAVSLNIGGNSLLGTTRKSSLMVIPQEVPYWNVKNDSENVNEGAYILLLCRIDVTHDGAEHNGDFVIEEDGKHIHQLFPTPDGGKYDPAVYGYVCVPLTDSDGGAMVWEAGKKYVYTLEFCGLNSGAGLYPPEIGPGLPDAPDTPSDKEPGDPVLDNPIKFTVQVGNWTNAWGEDDTNGGVIPMR